MTQPANSKRYRVALSYPGEHRPRVETIAQALALRLNREQILYDCWHAAEFNRLNLDVYLSKLYLTKLYHDESDPVAVFLSTGGGSERTNPGRRGQVYFGGGSIAEWPSLAVCAAKRRCCPTPHPPEVGNPTIQP